MLAFLVSLFRLVLQVPMIMFTMLLFIELGMLQGASMGLLGLLAIGLIAVATLSVADFLSYTLFVLSMDRLKKQQAEEQRARTAADIFER